MSIMTTIKGWLFGVELVSVNECTDAFATAIQTIDRDHDGMISVDEAVELVRRLLKR